MLGKILIANRGEIACRVIRTAKKMGIQTVSIYSDIDRDSKHVKMADQAFHVGPNPSALSYLNGDKILQIARENNCHGIHPGFGFLSENANFADSCAQNGLVFIGPPSDAIRKMGSKSQSKIIMEQANVPVVPGYHGEDQDPKFLADQADLIGYPVMIKAVMGGGGKGMKIVHKQSDFLESLESAKRESLKSFKDDRVILEKYIEVSKHIEIQVFGDHFKNYVYLFERDCSIQRRHQKILEEAPSNIGDLRHQIGRSAVEAARQLLQNDQLYKTGIFKNDQKLYPKQSYHQIFTYIYINIVVQRAVNYNNAGTVEFIFDVQNNQYYFMEMNTRLQVEHPITEMITKQDLVEWQLLVASGKELPLKQEQLKIHGHSLEARIYSEEPFNDFLPANGGLKYLREPQSSNVVRIESGVVQNDEISIFYDPMIAKLIVWGKDRDQAVKQLENSLNNYKILGLPTNIKFLKECVLNQDFKIGQYDTGFIQKNHDSLLKKKASISDQDLISMVLAYISNQSKQKSGFYNFRMNYNLKKEFKLNVTASHLKESFNSQVQVEFLRNGNVSLTVGSQVYENVSYKLVSDNLIEICLEQSIIKREFAFYDGKLGIFDEDGDGLRVQFENDTMPVQKVDASAVRKQIKSPMPGTLLKLSVKKGDFVKKDTTLLILEAMKMEHVIKASDDGVVKNIFCEENTFVEHGKIIIDFE